jgi:hypothetical protein
MQCRIVLGSFLTRGGSSLRCALDEVQIEAIQFVLVCELVVLC